MTRDDIDDLMRDNGIVVVGEAVYALCQIVAAAEREACAKLLEDFARFGDTRDCIAAIRASDSNG
jgi:hypothetical protein